MSTLSLQASLPWSSLHEEDRRFRLILLQSLLICLVVGAITPYIRIPQSDSGPAEKLPPRRVRLLTEQLTPALQPAPVQAVPDVATPPKAPTVPVQPPVARVVTPRQKASRTGVLAMSDALSELRNTTPRLGTISGQDPDLGRGPATATQPSMLTANVTRGSKGISGGVGNRLVLGASSLPGREENGRNISGTDGIQASGGPLAASPSGLVRSREEIQEVLDQNKGAMYTLYNRELREDVTLHGKLVMSITIAPAGDVTRCVILSSELGSASLEQQLIALIKRIDFGNKPGVPAVTTKIPIEFFPR